MANYGNAAYAYDMQAAPEFAPTQPQRRPQTPAQARPRFDVYTGAGNDANQVVSPVFMSVIKTFCVLFVLFGIIGLGRVALAGFTTATLNANAQIQTQMEETAANCKDLEVMRAVYGSESRIRELAEGYGLSSPESTLTLDFSGDAQALRDSDLASAQQSADAVESYLGSIH